MKKSLKDFTEEIRNKIPLYQERATKNLYSGKEYKDWKRQDTIDYIEKIYEIAGEKKPVVVIANTIEQYKLYYNRIFHSSAYDAKIEHLFDVKNNGVKLNKRLLKVTPPKIHKMEVPQHHYLFIASEYSRVYLMWYKFIKDEFKIETSKAELLDWFYNKVNKANIAKAFFCEKICLVLRMPKKINRNDDFLHCSTNEGAIVYDDKKYHFLNGRAMPDWVFDKYFSKTLTFNDFNQEKNEDVRGGIITLIKENEGNEGLLKFLNADLIDQQTITHGNGKKETLKYYKTKEKYSFLVNSKGNTNVPYAWLEEICPSTGQTYLIDSCPSFTNVLDAAKFHRPEGVSEKLDYNWQSFTA